MMDINQFKSYAFVDINSEAYVGIKPYYNELMSELFNENEVKNELNNETFSNNFVRRIGDLLYCLNSRILLTQKIPSNVNHNYEMIILALTDINLKLSDKFKEFIKDIFYRVANLKQKNEEKQPVLTTDIVDTIAEIVSNNPQKGFEDSPEGALATYANNMAFIPPYHSMQQQVLPQQTIPPIQQQMVLLNKPDIVDANYALKYNLRDINEINTLTTRINKVFANPEILEFINKFKFINKFYVTEYKKDEFTIIAPTSTSYVYIKVLSDGDYKVAEIPFKPN